MQSHAVPPLLTNFVGRSVELADLLRLLPGTRLLTLTGAGGSGKTRLARELAASLGQSYPVVAWADMTPVVDQTAVPLQIAAALRVAAHANLTVVQAIAEGISGSKVLLVVDNCEHIVEEVARTIESVLRSATQLTVIATSREALGIPGEVAWLVPPLSDEEAVQLFVDRAAAAMPGFALGESNKGAVSEICRRLDRLPLAIELAAARVRVLSLEQIAARLDDAFRLLTSGSRTSIPRHRTLRSAMDWSYQLLTEREQQLLCRLSVFLGSFSLESAEDVCAGPELEPEDILDGIAALVDKSLVVMESGDCVARYRLLETVRQYCAAKLTVAEGDRLRERHTHHFLHYAESMAPRLVGGEHEIGVAARMHEEHDNLREAAGWAIATPERGALALRFSDALFWYWYTTGYWFSAGEFRSAREYVLHALGNSQVHEPVLRGRALIAAGLVALAQGDYSDALRHFSESRALVDEHGSDAERVLVTVKLGAVRMMLGELDEATMFCASAHSASHSLPPQVVHAFINFWSGWTATARGDMAGAREAFGRSIVLGDRIGHRATGAHAASMLARVEYLEGNVAAAAELLQSAMGAHTATMDGWGLALDLEGSVHLAALLGELERAATLVGANDALRERIAVALPAPDRPARASLIGRLRSELGSRFELLYAEGRTLPLEQTVRVASAIIARITEGHSATLMQSGGTALEEPPRKEGVQLRVRALGPFQLWLDGREVAASEWGSSKPRELLVYLLLHRRGRTKEQVGLDFWPDASAAQLRNSFHVTLHRLRRALGTAELVVLDGDRYRIADAVRIEFDALSFLEHAPKAVRALQMGAAGSADALQQLLDSYRGDFMDGEVVGDWHMEYRDALRARCVEALTALGAWYREAARTERAADAFRRVLVRDPFNENAVRELMLLLAEDGNRHEVVRIYSRLSERLRKELELEPMPETTALYRKLTHG